MTRLNKTVSLEAERLRTSQLLDLAAFSPKLAQHFVVAGYSVEQAQALVEIVAEEMKANEPEVAKNQALAAFYGAASAHAPKPLHQPLGNEAFTGANQALAKMTPVERAAFEQKVAERAAQSNRPRAEVEARMLEIHAATEHANNIYAK